MVRNFADRPLTLRLTYRFASDFADLFEVRGEHRTARGESRLALESDHGVTLSYLGLDKIERVTQVAFSPAPNTLTTARATFERLFEAAFLAADLRTVRRRGRGGAAIGTDGCSTGACAPRGTR